MITTNQTNKGRVSFWTGIGAALFALATSITAGEREVRSDGHGDVSIDYAENQWQLGLRLDSPPGIHPPEEWILALNQNTKLFVPDNADFGFLGEAGNPIWVFPQVSREGTWFLGVSTDEIESGTFAENRFDLLLSSVEGPGDFVTWRAGTGQVEVLLNSRDGIDEMDQIELRAGGGHLHKNWGFTSPGTHFVGFQMRGTLAGASEPITSDEQLYRFAVNVLDRGEVEMEVAFEDGELELVLLDRHSDHEDGHDDHEDEHGNHEDGHDDHEDGHDDHEDGHDDHEDEHGDHEDGHGDHEDEHGNHEDEHEHEHSGQEFEANEAALHAGPSTWQKVPNHPAFAFLGNPGDTVYLLPQSEREGVLFLGIAGDEIESGIFENDVVALKLENVEGPGAVFLYATDPFGNPTVFFNSGDGISQSDVFPLSAAGHSHQNWGFTAPGIYRVGLMASGVLNADGQTVSSEETTFLFEVFGPTILNEGELDIEIVYEDGEWEIAALDEANDREICPSELILQGGAATQIRVPDNEAFRFLGEPGAVVNVLPQEEMDGVLFLGLAADEIESGIFENDIVELHLASVEGPGAVSLYSVDGLGNPTVFFNSGDGISQSDVFPLSAGGHSHQNWGFTAPGVYRVGLQASGTLAGESQASASEVQTFTFEILDESLSIGFNADGRLILWWHSQTNKQYQVQVKSGDIDADWTNRFAPLTGTGKILEQLLEMQSNSAEFFRILQLQ